MNYVPLVLAIVLLPSIAVAQQPSSESFETFEAIAVRSDAREVEVITRVAVYRQASTSSEIVETYVAGTGVGVAITHRRIKQNCSSDGDDTEGGLGGLGDAVACANPRNRLPLYVGLVLSGAVWIGSMVDAPKAVRAYNARLERSTLVIEPRLHVEHGALRPGLAARITLP